MSNRLRSSLYSPLNGNNCEAAHDLGGWAAASPGPKEDTLCVDGLTHDGRIL